MKTLRTALIGLGRIGWQYHLPSIVDNPGFEAVAVVDPLAERRQEARDAYGVPGFEDHASMLSEVRPDLVVIASPTPFHLAQALDAFAAGCDVFCDKPIATCLEDAEKMLDAAEQQGIKFMSYQPHRTHPDYVALLDILGRDLIGTVYMIKAARTRWRRRNDWQAWRKNGGGMLYNYGAHMIDQLLHVTQSRAKTVSCSLRSVATLGDADDVVKAVVETDTGVILDMDINQAAAWPVPKWHVFGHRGGAVYDVQQRAWRLHYYLEGDIEDLSLQQGLAAEGRIYKVGEISNWREEVFPVANYEAVDFYEKCYEYFAMDGAPLVSIAETRELMRVLDECSRKAEEGCWS